MATNERSAGIYVSISADGARDQAISARTYVRVRLRAAPGAFVSIVLTDTGVYRIAEQLDAERPPRIIAQGNLPSSRYVDERGWTYR